MSDSIYLPQATLYNSWDDYVAKEGKNPPPYNPEEPIKMWADKGVNPNATKMYDYYDLVKDKDGYFQYEEFSLTATQALNVNMLPKSQFPPYEAPSTGVTITSGPATIPQTKVDQYLSTKATADADAAELGGTVYTVPFDSGNTVHGVGEFDAYALRIPGIKQLQIHGWANGEDVDGNDLDGVPLMVGFLEFAKNYYGVGAPGHWDKNTITGTLKWVSDIQQVAGIETRPPVPRPKASPGPGKKLKSTPWGPVIVPIEDSDHQAPSGTIPFTQAHLDLLKKCAGKLGL